MGIVLSQSGFPGPGNPTYLDYASHTEPDMVDHSGQANPWLELYESSDRKQSETDHQREVDSIHIDIEFIQSSEIIEVLSLISLEETQGIRELAAASTLDIVAVDQVCAALQNREFVYQMSQGRYRTTQKGEQYIRNRWGH
jgi:predicted transcriptional regulator